MPTGPRSSVVPRTSTQELDRCMTELAAARHDVLTRAQLLALGMTPGGIDVRLASGRLHLQHRGVYAVGRRQLTRRGRWLAAVLAAGRGAALSHLSAAALRALVSDDRRRVDVTAASRSGRVRPGIALHRPRTPLRPDEVTVVDRIAVTTVARTLYDIAGTESPRRLRRAIERSVELRLFDLMEVEAIMARNPGRPNACRLVAALDIGDPAPTRSELERRFLELCRTHGLPMPAVNAPVEGLEVDFWWPAAGLVVETDGFATHGTRAAFERDRHRDAQLALAGLTVRRFSHRQVTREPALVARVLTASFAVRGSS